jgi:hypothetical protein
MWDNLRPPLAFGMLNPSTADHERNDATIERCERRARTLGFGSLVVWNLFALRSTNPRVLKKEADPVGSENDFFIQAILIEVKEQKGKVIVGWGSHGEFLERPQTVQGIAECLRIEFMCLGVTRSGQPKHPLYVSYDEVPRRWRRYC